MDTTNISHSIAPQRILGVEDSPLQAERLRRVLAEAGYRVEIARNGVEALEAARRERPALVIADIHMPVMDGYTLCRAIREDCELHAIPIILLTVAVDARDVIRGINAGADYYVTKPCDDAYLLSRVAAALEEGRGESEDAGRPPLEVTVGGQRYPVSAGRRQMLNLLVSTYENAVLQQRELTAVRDELQSLSDHLEEKVREQTVALAASEARWSALLHESPVCIFETDAQGEVQFVNGRWSDFTGFSSDQSRGRGWTRALHPDDRERVVGDWYRAVAREQPFRAEFRFLREDGAVSWVYGQCLPLWDGAGNLTGFVGTMTDITPSKQAETTIRLQAERYTALLATTSDGFWRFDGAGNLLDVNDAYCRMSGYSREQLLTMQVDELEIPGQAASLAQRLPGLSGSGFERFESRHRRKDGTVMDVEISVSATSSEEFVLFARDITERRRTEAALALLAAVVQQASDSVVITDPEGAIVYVNPFFEQITGYGAQEILGKNPRLLKSGYQSDGFYRELWDTLTAGKVWSGHLVNQRKDGSLYHEDATIFPVLDAEGHVLNYAGVKRDVTERMEVDIKIRKLTQLYATLSHTNQLIIRATTREELFAGVCEGAVEHGRFALAWVGLVDPATERILPVEVYGREKDYLSSIVITTGDSTLGPTGACIRENRVVYVNDFATDPRVLPCRDEALRRGLRGAAGMPLRRGGEVIGALTLYADVPGFFDTQQLAALEEMSSDLSFALDSFEREDSRRHAESERESALQKLRKMLEDSIHLAATTIELRDPYTAGHQQRVASLAVRIARELGWSESRIEGLYFGSLIHDIGKIYVPAEILSNPGQLSRPQMELVRIHAQVGYEVVRGIDFPWPVATMIHQHHERLDGSGYPNGLKHEDIIPEARILAIADVVEAISSHRPYRPGLGIDAALAEIEEGRGVRYDEQAVDACLGLFRESRFEFEN